MELSSKMLVWGHGVLGGFILLGENGMVVLGVWMGGWFSCGGFKIPFLYTTPIF